MRSYSLELLILIQNLDIYSKRNRQPKKILPRPQNINDTELLLKIILIMMIGRVAEMILCGRESSWETLALGKMDL